VEFRWDEAKRRANLRKHGIDFLDVPPVFDGPTATIEDDRFDYSERRLVTFGLLGGQVVAITHTEDEDTIRIISARKATNNEERSYFATISH
jgi:hypothetical protein